MWIDTCLQAARQQKFTPQWVDARWPTLPHNKQDAACLNLICPEVRHLPAMTGKHLLATQGKAASCAHHQPWMPLWVAQGQPSACHSPVTQWHFSKVSPVQLSWSRFGSCSVLLPEARSSCSPCFYTVALENSEGFWWPVFSWFSIWAFLGIYFAVLELWNVLLKSIPKDVMKALSRSSCVLLILFYFFLSKCFIQSPIPKYLKPYCRLTWNF